VRTILFVWLVFVVAPASFAAVPADAAAQASPVGKQTASGNFVGLVEIGGGRRIWLECNGSGSPTVILESGYRTAAMTWTEDLEQPSAPRTMVLPSVARKTRVCTYERPGAAAELPDGFHPSRSDPVPMPRSAGSVVADLHALLDAAGEPGPYVLVGHSLGGLFVRLYTATYPDDVAGMVLVDALSPPLETFLGPKDWETYVRFNLAHPAGLPEYPALETLDFGAATRSLNEAVAASPLRPMPLFVLSKGKPFGVTAEMIGFDPAVLETAWAKAQNGLTTLLPGARHAVATKSSHYIQIQQPDLVINAIDEVVDAVRDPDLWKTTRSSAPRR
jgi:pimeloyl-ACP methyl ester carboxylesterase